MILLLGEEVLLINQSSYIGDHFQEIHAHIVDSVRLAANQRLPLKDALLLRTHCSPAAGEGDQQEKQQSCESRHLQ